MVEDGGVKADRQRKPEINISVDAAEDACEEGAERPLFKSKNEVYESY